jgi:cytochrome c biogenesis protein
MELKKNKGQGIWRILKRKLGSLKLTIILFIILAVAAIQGTIIPQGQPTEFYAHKYPWLYTLFIPVLRVDDLYHSWWFSCLLGLLTANLIACTFPRLKSIWQSMTSPADALTVEQESRWNLKHKLATGFLPLEARQKTEEVLKRSFAAPRPAWGKDGNFMFAQSGKYSRLGVPLTHLSILVIILGAIVGSLLGFNGMMNLNVGESSGKVLLRGGFEQVNLKFDVRCNDFNIDYYPNGSPSEYVSDLSVFSDGREAARKKVKVNHPLKFHGISFFQSSYGISPNAPVTLKVKPTGEGSWQEYRAVNFEQYKLPGEEGAFRVIEILEDFQGLGPAAKVLLELPSQKPIMFWVFKKYPDFDGHVRSGFIFNMVDFEERFYTGLQVVYDPGVWLIWVGAIMLTVGIGLSFYWSHRRILVRVDRTEEGSNITIAGVSNKNKEQWQKDFEKIVSALEKELGAEQKS